MLSTVPANLANFLSVIGVTWLHTEQGQSIETGSLPPAAGTRDPEFPRGSSDGRVPSLPLIRR